VCFDATDHFLMEKILHWLQKEAQSKIIHAQSIDLQTTLDKTYSFLDMGFMIIYEHIDMISPIIMGFAPDAETIM
jgi:hypothetical protein